MVYLLVAEWEQKERANFGKGVRIVILMPTLQQFKKVHAAQLVSDLSRGGDWGFLGAEVNRTDWRFTFPNGSWIQVVSSQNADANRGIRCDAVIIDEADDVDIRVFDSVMTPWFTEPHSLKMVLFSGTPRRGRYGLLWKAYRIWPFGDADHDPLPNHHSFHATAYDAPDYVDPSLVALERSRVSPDTFAREWLCDFDSGEGLVYPFFNVAFHVKEPPSLAIFNQFIVGVDHGFNDPTVMLVIGIAGKGRDAICHILREEYHVGLSATEVSAIAKRVASSFPNAKWYADHAPSINKQIRDDAHVDLVEAEKGPGSVEDGVAYVADALFIRETEDGARWSQLYVDPSCKHTIDEFGLYRRKRDPRNSDRVLDDIDTSKNDHCCDAIRYALFSHFGGRDRRLVVG